MSEEKINYWLEVFRDNKYAFMSKDGLVIPLYTVFEQLKEYKSVLDEIREYINKNTIFFATKEKVGNYFANCSCDDLLQILDKVKE